MGESPIIMIMMFIGSRLLFYDDKSSFIYCDDFVLCVWRYSQNSPATVTSQSEYTIISVTVHHKCLSLTPSSHDFIQNQNFTILSQALIWE